MANAKYPKFMQALLEQSANSSLVSGNVKVILVDTADYTYSAAHEFLTSVPGAARVDISGNLTGKTFADGVFDADNPVFGAATGDPAEALIYFIDTGVEATSRLVLYLDSGVTGLPVTPNSGDINVSINASGIFAL